MGTWSIACGTNLGALLNEVGHLEWTHGTVLAMTDSNSASCLSQTLLNYTFILDILDVLIFGSVEWGQFKHIPDPQKPRIRIQQRSELK